MPLHPTHRVFMHYLSTQENVMYGDSVMEEILNSDFPVSSSSSTTIIIIIYCLYNVDLEKQQQIVYP